MTAYMELQSYKTFALASAPSNKIHNYYPDSAGRIKLFTPANHVLEEKEKLR